MNHIKEFFKSFVTTAGKLGINKEWFFAALIRAVRTFIQTAGGVIGTSTYLGDINWQLVLSASTVAALLSLITSLGGLPEVKT